VRKGGTKEKGERKKRSGTARFATNPLNEGREKKGTARANVEERKKEKERKTHDSFVCPIFPSPPVGKGRGRVEAKLDQKKEGKRQRASALGISLSFITSAMGKKKGGEGGRRTSVWNSGGKILCIGPTSKRKKRKKREARSKKERKGRESQAV